MSTRNEPDAAEPAGRDGAPADAELPGRGGDHEALQDIKQLGLCAAVASLGYVFWVVGGMEMVERLA